MPRVVGGPLTGPFAQVAAQLAQENLQQQQLNMEAARLHAQTASQVRETKSEAIKLQQAQDRWQAEQAQEDYWKGLDFELRTKTLLAGMEEKKVDQYLKQAGIDVDVKRQAQLEKDAAEKAAQFQRTEARLAFQAAQEQETKRAGTAARVEADQLQSGLKLGEQAVKWGIVPERPGSRVMVQITPNHPLWEAREQYRKWEETKLKGDKDRKNLEVNYDQAVKRADMYQNKVWALKSRLAAEEDRLAKRLEIQGPLDLNKEKDRQKQDALRKGLVSFNQDIWEAERLRAKAQAEVESLAKQMTTPYGMEPVPTPGPAAAPAKAPEPFRRTPGVTVDVDAIKSAADLNTPEFKAKYAQLPGYLRKELADELRRKRIL